ncbi:MAG: type IV pilus biogenesis protein PilM [Vibrio sp.]
MGISSRVTGVDFGHHSIKAVTLTPSHEHTYDVMACSELLVSDAIFADNDMLDYQKIVKKLKELKKTFPRFSRNVAVTLADSSIITKELQLDSYENPDKILLTMMSEQCGIDAKELAIDYFALPFDSTITNITPTYRVFAARKALIANRVGVLKAAGLRPYLINSQAQGLLQIYVRLMARSSMTCAVLFHVDDKQATLCYTTETQAPCCYTFSYPSLESTIGVAYPTDWVRRIIPAIQRFQSLHLRAAPHCVWVSGIGSHDTQAVTLLGEQLGFSCCVVSWLGVLHETGRTRQCDGRFTAAIGGAMQGLAWQEGHHV